TKNNSIRSSGGSPSTSACSIKTRPLHSCLAFRRSIAFHMMERIDEGDLQLDLLATQRGCSGQRRDQINGAGKLGRSFEQRGTLQRPLPRLAPPFESADWSSASGLRTTADSKAKA